MLQCIEVPLYDVLSHVPPLPGRGSHMGVVADRDVPLFALLRSTQGLPLDDRRWWPEGRGVFPLARELSTPTVELLERTLAGLRAWDTAWARSVDGEHRRA